MSFRLHTVLALSLLPGLLSCKSNRSQEAAKNAEPAATRSANATIRNNALALLKDLLGDEKNLSKLLIIKHESAALNRLVKDISSTAAHGSKLVESVAKKDRNSALARADLPAGEIATRKTIAKTKEHILLHAKGAEFEFQLLLTQSEALNYGRHLAAIVAENETQPEQAKAFSDLSLRIGQLLERVQAMLRRPS